MTKQILLKILIYFILFISQNHITNAKPLNELLDIKNYDAWNQPKILFYDEFSNWGDPVTRYKREINGSRKKKLNYLQQLSESIYKTPVGKSKMSNSLTSKSWGAVGMPFNVLYTPNSYQQKILKSNALIEDKVNILKSAPKKQKLEVYDLVLENKKPLKVGGQVFKKHVIPRKYYSIIPQFFVSYGWK